MDVTVAGLPLVGDNEIVHPIAAVVCIKAMDAEGKISFWSQSTGGLSLTEAQGMALGLLDDLREARSQS